MWYLLQPTSAKDFLTPVVEKHWQGVALRAGLGGEALSTQPLGEAWSSLLDLSSKPMSKTPGNPGGGLFILGVLSPE